MPIDEDDNGERHVDEYNWVQYRRLILSELRRISNEMHSLNTRLDKNREDINVAFERRDRAIYRVEVEVATLNTKVMIAGAVVSAGIAGAVSVAINKFLS